MTEPFTPQPSCADPGDIPDLMPVSEARAAMLAGMAAVSGVDAVPLPDALGRVLAEDVIAPIDVPGHDNSAMDGFALRADDLPRGGIGRFTLVGEAWAGRPFSGTVQAGQAVKVATGAVMPRGADTVVIQERVRVDGGVLEVLDGERALANVRAAGEDTRAGDVALAAGTRLMPAEIGYLASLGVRSVCARRRVRVAFFSTGDELVSVESGQPLQPGQVYDSNRHSLRAALETLGVEVRDLGIVVDDAAATEAAFHTAASDADAVVATGGASVSDADHVAATLRAHGRVTFWRVAMRPGRPLASGRVGDAHFFGLPGNPVATLVSYYQFVLPALKRLMGCRELMSPTVTVRCGSALKKSPGRVEYQRGVMTWADGEPIVHSTGRQGAGRLSSMVQANCFIVLSPEQAAISPGDWVEVQLFEGLI
ncbi:MAG: gephyrin-like molybdotransferase Glp [Pseudomonadota bacterium]